MKACVTNLAKYTEGQLVGKWVDFPMDEEQFTKVLESIGVKENSAYEEYFITDYETSYIDAYEALGEYPSIDDLNEFAEIYENESYTYYAGMTLSDVAYWIVDECYDLPEIAKRYFNYDAFTRDLGFNGYSEMKNGVIKIH